MVNTVNFMLCCVFSLTQARTVTIRSPLLKQTNNNNRGPTSHHHDLGSWVQGHLIGHRAWGDPVNEDAREVPTDDTYLLQQSVPLEGQHCDLAQNLAGRPPPHRDTAAGREVTEFVCGPEQEVQPCHLPTNPLQAPALWNSPAPTPRPHPQKGCHLPTVIGHHPHSATCSPWPRPPLTWLRCRGSWRLAAGCSRTQEGLHRTERLRHRAGLAREATHS